MVGIVVSDFIPLTSLELQDGREINNLDYSIIICRNAVKMIKNAHVMLYSSGVIYFFSFAYPPNGIHYHYTRDRK